MRKTKSSSDKSNRVIAGAELGSKSPIPGLNETAASRSRKAARAEIALLAYSLWEGRGFEYGAGKRSVPR
jgi:hypothetical protein